MQSKRALVLAEINRIDAEFGEIKFDYMGGAVSPYTPLPYDQLKSIVNDYQVIVSEFDTIDRGIIDHAANLQMIICCRGGVKNVVDVDYAMSKGIVVKNTPGRNANAVAEYVIGMILNHDRSLSTANDRVLSDDLQRQCFCKTVNYKDTLWGMDENSPYHIFRGRGLRNITLGIIGYGYTGTAVTHMAVALGMNVLLCSRHVSKDTIPVGVELVDLEYLLMHADYISLHCSNPDHRAIIGRDELCMMKRSAYLINAARGDVLDEDALIDALDEGIIAGAALDVTRQEPLLPDSRIIHARNISITPHIAGATNEVIDYCTDLVRKYLREYLHHEDVVSVLE